MKSKVLGVCALLFVIGFIFTVARADEKLPKKRLPTRVEAAVKRIENDLKTKLVSKENPADKHTYYVIRFREEAAARTQGASQSGNIITLRQRDQVAWTNDAIMVQGRRETAIAIFDYLMRANSAAKHLVEPTNNEIQESVFGGSKKWETKPFADKMEAEAYLAEVKPRE